MDAMTQPCFVCKKVHNLKDVEQYYYHESVGFVCKSHNGVKEWFDELWEKSISEMEDLFKL